MFILSNFVMAIAQVFGIIISIFMWMIIIRALISWVNPDPYNPIVQFLSRMTDPLLGRIRRLIPMYNIGIDLSPIIAILIIIFLKAFVVGSLIQIAQRLH